MQMHMSKFDYLLTNKIIEAIDGDNESEWANRAPMLKAGSNVEPVIVDVAIHTPEFIALGP